MDWRPKNWDKIREEYAATGFEAGADAILEALLKTPDRDDNKLSDGQFEKLKKQWGERYRKEHASFCECPKLTITIHLTQEDTKETILRKLDNIKDCILKGIFTSGGIDGRNS